MPVKNKSCLIICLFALVSLPCWAQSTSPKQPVAVIFDTDIGPDYDDVGAMAVLHALADSGEAKILATIACNQSKYIAGVLNAINTYFNRPGIPVGVNRSIRAVNISAWQKWDSVLVARYPGKIKRNDEAQDAVELYRKLLAAQPDNSVTIVTVGFFSNLNDLLKSPGDKISYLNGLQLVEKKVKRLVSMAGRFPKAMEYNIQCDPISANYVAENWPGEIIFSGWEIGNAIHTGLPLINNKMISGSPVKDVFAMCIPMAPMDSLGRMSWDETAVLVGVRGSERFYSLVEGRMIVEAYGGNDWNKKGKGHYYLVEKMPVGEMEKILNDLIMHQPLRKK